MIPFRKNVAIAIDGGGIRGVIVARALSMLEEELQQPVNSIFHLAAGTSTGSILAAGIAAGISAQEMYRLYLDLGKHIFRKTWRTRIWPLTRYRYSIRPLETALSSRMGELKMGGLWQRDSAIDLVITTFDLVENRTRFIKPWKSEYHDWTVVKSVLASCAVPTYFPIVEGKYIDGGVGGFSNPCYLAAYELLFCLGWKPAETTLISLGTGRGPHSFNPKQAVRLQTWQWIAPMIGAFMQSADDQQVHLIKTFFQDLDFRRYQVNLSQPIDMDDASKLGRLAVYGDELGRMILQC